MARPETETDREMNKALSDAMMLKHLKREMKYLRAFEEEHRGDFFDVYIDDVTAPGDRAYAIQQDFLPGIYKRFLNQVPKVLSYYSGPGIDNGAIINHLNGNAHLYPAIIIRESMASKEE
jgi:hypothetical protein